MAHRLSVCAALVGLLIGPAFFFGGVIAGFFGDLILERISDDRKIKAALRGGTAAEKEPFPGCAAVCALGVYSLGDAESAGKIARAVLGKKCDGDWEHLCALAGEADALNGDLLAESLAARILRGGLSTELLSDALAFLRACERMWDDETRGERPSAYLSRLLSWRVSSGEIESAYRVLGLDSSASRADVKRAHRTLAAECHPDAPRADEARFMEVQRAYETIMGRGALPPSC